MAKLETYDFSIGFNTPAFLGDVPASETKSITCIKGGHQKEFTGVAYYPIDPMGVRVPSLRGVLEFWYRTLFGGSDSREIYRCQAEVFGSADRGQGVRLIPQGSRFETGTVEYSHDRNKFLYLGYGPLQYVNPGQNSPNLATSHNEKAFRDAICPQTEPVSRFRAVGTSVQLKEFRKALRLLHLFGGMGGRSRRCWGSVFVEGLEIAPVDASSMDELAAYYALELASLWEPDRGPNGVSSPPRHSAFHTGSQVQVTPLRDRWEDVLGLFYERFAETRLWNMHGPSPPTAQKDHDLEMADAASPGPLTGAPQRLAFGLPYHPGRHWKIEYAGTRRLKPTEPLVKKNSIRRRASPLLLKVVRLANGKHAGVALFLGGQFFGDASLQLGALHKTPTAPRKAPPVPKTGSVPVPDYSAVDEFLSEPSWTSVPLPK